MKPSEILRNLADMIDARQQERESGVDLAVPQELISKQAGPKYDNNGLAKQPDDVMIPPLQLKIELLKKATGVENVYDENNENDEDSEGSNSYDELEIIKKHAGINPVVLDALGDDEPLDV